MPEKASQWKRWTKIFRPKAIEYKLAWCFTIALNVWLIVGSLNQGNDLRSTLFIVLFFGWWAGFAIYFYGVLPGFYVLGILFELIVNWEIERRERQKKKK